jgi:uncharacterized protein YlxW (UPF0749 family)
MPKKKLKSGIVIFVTTILTILIMSVIYGAWTPTIEKHAGDMLISNDWNAMQDNLEELKNEIEILKNN